MRKTPVPVLGIIMVSIALCGLTGAQSNAKKRTPVLTNDDLGSVARETVSELTETEAQPRASREPEAARGAIVWQRDLRRAVELASAEGKLVVADVYTDWCGWCKKMDQNIYSDPAIATLSRQQVFVKVNAEDRGDGQRFAEQMGVRGYPTTVILDAQGRVLNIARGYIASPRAFGKLVQEALAQAR